MSEERASGLLGALLAAIGVVAIGTGIFGVLGGSGAIPGDQEASASVESELRFFTVFWIAYGAAALWASRNLDRAGLLIQGIAAAMFVGGLARGLAWIDAGRPETLFVVLMVLELAIPPVLLLLQRRSG